MAESYRWKSTDATFYKGLGTVSSINGGLKAIAAWSYDCDKMSIAACTNRHFMFNNLSGVDFIDEKHLLGECVAKGQLIKTADNKSSTKKTWAMEQLVLGLNIFIDDRWYAKHVSNRDDGFFQRAPFQSLMFYYTVFWLIERHDLTDCSVEVFMELKEQLGLGWLTRGECELMRVHFQKTIAAHIIPRRHGKTAFSKIMIGLSLALFPRAKFRLVYCAHNRALPKDMYTSVVSIINSVKAEYNHQQQLWRSAQKHLGHVSGDKLRPCYKLSYAVDVDKREVTCYFTPIVGDQTVYANTCRCVCYQQNQVCAIKS